MKAISKSFELRYFSQDDKANGETDFKGETSVLDTDQRISFLNEYANQMEKNRQDVDLYNPIVTASEVKTVLGKIKVQPLPEHRKRIILDEWNWVGSGKEKKQSVQMQVWKENKDIDMVEECLCFNEKPLLIPICHYRIGDAF